ncbi:HlyC/CorC family transporter [Thiohalomonas denitrificans]|uniref:HlyC/CorC family transporter n=1 Tax=Thiohalomonas denitrificans TaxID=415747 RepID=UPI0026EBAFDB|nr:transporter associated domain-containing protein [Thiohalomonas denitrificans]
MNDDRPSSAAGDERPQKSWLERLGQVLQPEPKDREELLRTLKEAQQRDLIDADAYAMIQGVLEVSEMQVRDIMIPRSHMNVVERDATLQEILPIIIKCAHSRFPVIGDNRDEVVGILLAKDLLPFVANGGGGFNIREVLRPALFVPESKRLNVLLKEFRSSRNHLAVVVDEYGGVAGLVTIEDVLEQIVGEIEDEHDVEEEDTDILQVADGRHMVRALTAIDDFNEFFRTNFSDEEFDTIGGLVLKGFGHMPKRGEQLEMGQYRFTVLRADSRRIYLLEVAPLPQGRKTGTGDSGEPLSAT